MNKKWLNVFSFFKSIFIVNFLFSILCLIFIDTKSFTICFLTFGYFLSLLLKELYPKRKAEYIFYYNNGLTKVELLIYCFLLNLVVIILINLIIFICHIV